MTSLIIYFNVRLGEALGSGQFGDVHQGVYNKDIKVAVKTLKEGAGEEDRVKFMQEAAIMGQFKHFNVVTMHGVVTDGEPVSTKNEVQGLICWGSEGRFPPTTSPLSQNILASSKILCILLNF